MLVSSLDAYMQDNFIYLSVLEAPLIKYREIKKYSGGLGINKGT